LNPEPIHGSAPKYKGMGVANPVATIWAGSLLLDHLGEHEAAAAIVKAIEKSIKDGVVTKDLGGKKVSTSKAGSYIADCVKKGK
jgi:tartrate dehydrogenase/decarboxylase / D-malate dehydrogenase